MENNHNYKIKSPLPISDDEILETKNFKKLTYNYQKFTRPLSKTPLYKRQFRKIWMILLLIGLVVWLIIEFG